MKSRPLGNSPTVTATGFKGVAACDSLRCLPMALKSHVRSSGAISFASGSHHLALQSLNPSLSKRLADP
jgi:hypothetical protein